MNPSRKEPDIRDLAYIIENNAYNFKMFAKNINEH